MKEGEETFVTATLNKSFTQDTTVTISAAPVLPADVGDYQLSNTTLTFAKGAFKSTGEVKITAVDNAISGPPTKEIKVSAINSDNVTLDEATLTIMDDEDKPKVTLKLDPNPISEYGGSTTVTATLNPPSSQETTVTISAEPVSPATTDHYLLSPTNETLTIAAGDINSTGRVTITANDNDIFGPPEKQIRVSGTASDHVDAPEDVILKIQDNEEAPKVSLTLKPESINEDGESATVTAALDRASNQDTTVTISAMPGFNAMEDDYALSDNKILTIVKGKKISTGDVKITAVDNAISGPPTKEITVSAINSDKVIVDRVTLTIRDDEDKPKVTLILSSKSIPENGEFTTVTATLAPPSSQTTTVTISAKAISPAEGNDYQLSVNTTLTIDATKTSSTGTVTITANDNDIFGPPEKQIRVSGTASDHVDAPEDVILKIQDNEEAPKVSLTLKPESINEDGESATVTAALDRPSNQDTTVTISAMPGFNAMEDDYALSDNKILTIVKGKKISTGDVKITAVDNAISGPPTKGITVSAINSDKVIVDRVTLTIKDDEDKPKVTLKLSRPSISENGGSTTVTADLDSPSSEKTTVTISATPVSPAAVGDYKLSDNTKLTFEAGQTESNGTVTITAEDNEGFGPLEKKITVSGTVPAHVIAPEKVTLTITDDEKAPRSLPTVTLSAKPNPVVEGYTTTLTATLLRPAATEVVIELVYEDMTTEPGDYSTPPSLTIKAGESSGSRKLEILDDSIVEPDESFRVRLLKPEGIDLGNPSEVEITIRDDGDTAPPVEVTLEVKPQSVIEGKNVTVTVTLQGKLDKEVTIPLTYPLDGATAIINTDYIPVEKIVIEAGETSNFGTIQTLPESEEEGEETFTVAFGALPPEVSGGMHLSQEVTIVDQGQPPEVSLSVDQRRIDEGDQVTVTLKISSPLDDGVTIPLTLTNGTTTSEDYRLSGSPDLVIPGGKDEAELMIEALNDSLLEEDETFKIALSDVPNAVVQGTPSEIEMTIIDTDVPTIDAPTSVPILEGKQETITVTLGAIPLGAVSIAVTGQSGTDLSVAPSRWVFSDKAQEVTLTAGEDDDVTSDNIKLLLTADGGAYSGVPHEIQVTINDDDQPGLLVVPNPIPMDEGSSRSMDVRLTQQPSAEVPIAMTVVGAGLRLISPPELTFTTLNWDVDQSVEIMAEKDYDAEENEPVQLFLSASGGGYAGISKTVMVTIRETDQKGLIVEPRSIEIEEGSSDEVRVSLNSKPVGEVTVGISGHEGSDVRLQPSSLTFGPADRNTWKSLMIRAETDSDLDDDPPVRLILWARGGNYDGQQAEVEVTILDQGLPEITIYESQALENKRMIKMPITLSHPTDAVVTVQYTTQEQTGEATVGDDYTASRGIVIFDPRATSGIVQIEIIDDETPEGDETFTVILSNAKHATIARESATATIVDDDGGIPVLTIEDAVVSPDAHVVTFQIYVSQPSSQSISVRYRTADGTATAGQDYMQRSGLATITPGTVQTTIEVPLLNTEAKQQRETFYVHLESSEVVQINKAVATAVIDKEINQAQTALTEYTARFVRTLSVQLTEALQDRLRSTGSMCLAAERAEMVQRWQWTPSLGELLSGCQVSETSGHVGVWGRGAFRRFHGRDDQDLRGDVSSAIIGADYRSERGWLAGVMVAYSQGAGTYNDTDVETGLTGVYPYASYEASKWEIWMSGGYGWGHAETQILDGDLTSRFGAVGFKAQLASAGSAQLSYYGDVILTDAEVDVTDLRAEVIRVRLGIESSFALSQEVRPFVEANVRQDGGDAETGIGLEFGGGLRVAYPQWRLRGEVRSQGLVLHSADGFTEWGVSGSIQVGNPSEGLMMRVRPSWGPNHSMALYRQQTILDVAPYQSGMHRTEVEIGYGVPVSRGSVRSIVGVTELPSGRLFRLGGQLSPWTRMSLSVSGLAHHHQSNIGDMSVNVQASLQH